MSRLIGRGTQGNLPNSWDRQIEWKQQVQMRGEQRQKRVNKKERVEGKKETFEVGEKEKLQVSKSLVSFAMSKKESHVL